MRAVKYGTTRDYVQAMTVVLPTGKVIHLGAPVSKTSSGYSLLNLIIGSEGTLGIITELTLKLIAPPKCHVTLIVPFAELADGIGAVPAIKHSGLDPQTLESSKRKSWNLPKPTWAKASSRKKWKARKWVPISW